MDDEFKVVDYVTKLEKIFEKNKDDSKAIEMKKYMRNQFEFYGLQANKRRKLSKELKEETNRPPYRKLKPVIIRLWTEGHRESQYFAMELFEKYKNNFRVKDIELMEYMIINKPWWDTVDFIAKKLVGRYFLDYCKKRDQYMSKWLSSDNIWLKRTTLLFQLSYKENTDIDILFENIKRLKDIDNFFIQKAIGWALREYSKTDPFPVKKFIKNHKLSKLSTREGLKIINRT